MAPDPTTISPARYSTPGTDPTTVTVIPVDPADMPPAPTTDAERAQSNGYQRLELDILSQTLTVRVMDWRAPRPDPETLPPNPPRHCWEAPAVPERIGWTIITARYDSPPLTADELNTVANAAAPHAARLIDRLYAPEPDPGPRLVGWWSAGSHSSATAIARLCDGRADDTYYQLSHRLLLDLDMEDAARIRPEGIMPEWADKSDAELWADFAALNPHDTADTITRFWANEHWGNLPALETAYKEQHGLTATPDRPLHVELWGVIPYLVAYRAAAAAKGTRVESADAYLHARPELWRDVVNQVPATADDATLEAVADDLRRTARDRDAVTLAGADSYVLGLRRGARRAVVDRLSQVAAQCAELEDRLKGMRSQRRALLTQYMTWHDGSDSEIAKTARVTKQMVSKLRTELTDTADDE